MARLLSRRWVHRPLARSIVVDVRALVLLLLMVLAVLAGCESASDEPQAGASREVADGVTGQLVSDGEIAYLSSTGLGSFITTITALSPGGAPLWSVVAGGAMMVGEDGLLYSGGDGFISAIDRRGVRTAFDAPGLGSLSWHPWNVPMTWGQRGFLVLDRFGNTLIRRWEDVHVHAVAAAGDGTIFALVTESDLTGTEATWLWKLTADLELVWWLAVEGSGGTPTGHHLALHRDEFVVFSSGGGTEARAFDGEFRWRIVPAVGRLVVDGRGTTYISSARRTAVAADGTILWDEAGRVEMALTGNGLAATHVVTSRFGSPVPGLSLVNPSTGELSQTTLFPDSTDFLAPVVAGGRLVGASHRIDISQGVVGGDISVSQAAVSIVVAGPSAAAPVDGWPTASGPGGRGALPAREIQPSERDLIGLWVAVRDGAGRAIRFTDQAPAFGLFGEQIYGIWDGPLDDAPRLVQVGTWDLEQDQLQLTPVEDLVGAAGRTSLRIRPARPGVLSMDDPVDRVVRAFVRAARLPDATSLGDAPQLQFIDESGARRAEFGRIVGVFPTGDGGAWAVGTYSGTGYFGTRQFRPSFVETVGSIVTSTLDHMIVGRLSPSGEWTRYFHHEVDGGPQPLVVVPDGEGALLLGPMAVGARERRSVLGLRLAPTGENDLEAVEEIPWPSVPDDEGWTLESNINGIPYSDVLGVLPDGDIVLRAFRADMSQRQVLREHMRAVVFRAGRDGTLRWETPLPIRMDQAVLLGGTTNAGDGGVYVFGSSVASFETPAGALDAWEASRAFVARLNLDTGAWEGIRALGGGRPANDLLRGRVPAVPRADGGFVLLETPAGLQVPFATGTGRTVRRPTGTAHVLAAFDRELDSLWTTVIGSDVLDGQSATPGQTRGRAMLSDLAGLEDGSLAVGGYTMETFAVNDRVEGGGTRNAPVLAFSRCGGLLPIRWFRSRIELDTVTADGDALWAGGSYRSDIIEPPFTIGWPGRLATPSEPVGNYNNLLMRLRMGRIADAGAPCPAPVPGTVDLHVSLRGTGEGRVVSSPPGIDCPGACVATFDELTTVTFTSIPADGSTARGARVTGGVYARCAADDDVCDVLATDDAVIEAHFDSITATWAHAIPFRSNGWARGPWPVGETVAVAGQLAGPLSGAFGTWDPATQGDKVVVFVGPSGPSRVVPVPYAQDMIAVTPAGDVVAAVEVADMRRLDPSRTWTDRYTLIAVEPDGAVRWAVPLPNPMSGTQVRVAINGDRVGVTWLTTGAVTLGELDIDVAPAIADIAFATLDVATGEVLGLTPVGPRPAGLRANELGGFTLHGSLHAAAGFGGTYGPVPLEGPPLPEGRTGATLLRYGRDGAFVDATQWATSRTVLRSSMGRDANQNPGAADVRIDGLLPAWVVHLGDITHFAPDGTALAANAPTINQWAALANYERYQAVLQRLTSDGRVADAWVVRTEDEVAVRGVTAWQQGAAALVAATRIPDAAGDALVEDAEFAVVGLRYGRGGER